MREGLRRLLVLAAVSLYAATPGVSIAVAVGDCECTGAEGIKCGASGFLCQCCLLPAGSCGEVSFSTCKGTASFEAHTQPPAVYEPMAGIEPIFYLTPSLFSPRPGPEEGFHFLREKPPSAS